VFVRVFVRVFVTMNAKKRGNAKRRGWKAGLEREAEVYRFILGLESASWC